MATIPDLESLRWHYRAVLVFAASNNDRNLEAQNAIVEGDRVGFDERDIKLFTIVGDGPKASVLRQKLQVPEQSFAVVLIGKDGTVKLRKTSAITAAQLFRTIDQMPMRRDEMQRSGTSNSSEKPGK